MAQIKWCYACPRCGAGITSLESTTRCPDCALPLGKQDLDPYTPPYTFSEQHEKYRDTEKLVTTLAELPIEKANSILNDALLSLENIAGKKTHISDISLVVKMGKRIGKIAVAYENFLGTGGKHHPSFFTKEQQQQKEIQTERPRTAMGPGTPRSATPDVSRDPSEVPPIWDQSPRS
jgi:hypothetical protein